MCGLTGMGEYFSQVTPRNGAKSIAVSLLFYLKSLCKEMSLGGEIRGLGGGGGGGGYPRAPPLYETLPEL